MSRKSPDTYLKAADRWFGRSGEQLSKAERKALRHASEHQALSADPNQKLDEQSTLGERLADRVASFGGSWTFIMIFGVFLAFWATLNTEVLGKTAFDPYPYIFLNLMLSMIAALQAPIIMMSQNRASAKDRQMAAHDYEINLKAEIEIMALHDKLDSLRSEQLVTMIERQQEQIALLARLIEKLERSGPREA